METAGVTVRTTFETENSFRYLYVKRIFQCDQNYGYPSDTKSRKIRCVKILCGEVLSSLNFSRNSAKRKLARTIRRKKMDIVRTVHRHELDAMPATYKCYGDIKHLRLK